MNTLQDAIARYIERLQPTQEQLKLAKERREKAIQKLHRTEFGVANLRQSGSLAKHTAIAPVRDADVIAYMRQGTSQEVAIELFDKLADWMREEYRGSGVTVRRQPHTIGIIYESGPNVDIVPGITVDDKGRKGLILNRHTGEWIQTNPVEQKEAIDYIVNKEPRFLDLVRLAKVWGKKQKHEYESYAMELLAGIPFLITEKLTVADDWPNFIYGFLWGVGYQVENEEPLYDWGSPNYNIFYDWTHDKLWDLKDAAYHDMHLVKDAIKAEKVGDMKTALKLMRQVFGDEFTAE